MTRKIPAVAEVASRGSRARSSYATSAVTNRGRLHLLRVREDSPIQRRFRDLLHAHETDLGGHDHLSEGQRSIIRRAATLEIQLEIFESRFAAADDGCASVHALECYQRCSNSLRRLLESLGLHQGRKARDVTPTVEEYAEQCRRREREGAAA